MLTFITGATGFIGSNLAMRLASRGDELKCLARETSDLNTLKKLNVSIVSGDMKDKDALHSAMDGVETVYHNAAVVGEWLSENEALEVNVKGTQNLLEASLEAGVKKFVYVSSLAVLGMKHHQNTPADAPHQKTGDIYSDSKIDSEKTVMDFYEKHGLPVVIVRPGFVFGPGDKRFIPNILRLLNEGRFMFLGGGNNVMNLVYIDNLIDVLVEAGRRKEAVGQVYNITNKDKTTMKDFIYTICDISGLKRPRKSLPFPVAKTLASILEAIGRMAKKKTPPLLTKARVKVSGLNLDFDISKAVKELGYDSKVSIKEGLERTLASL